MKHGSPPWKSLSTEAVNPRSHRLDRLGVAGVVALMQSEDRRVLAALSRSRSEIVRAAELLRDAFLGGKRCVLFGAGTSGRLAVIEAAELPPTFGIDPRRVSAEIAGGRGSVFHAREGAEDRGGDGRRLAGRLARRDLAIGVSASSVTPFVRSALERARECGAGTVLVTAARAHRTEDLADVVIRLDVGPEILAGSTRLKAGTATKLALNQITTAAFTSSGKVYGPWMVDLSAGSAKLKDRSLRIVASAAGATPRRAAALLERAGGEVKTAIVMGRLRIAPAAARRRLAEAGDDVRRAVERLGAAKHDA